jgi:hypothetical protein
MCFFKHVGGASGTYRIHKRYCRVLVRKPERQRSLGKHRVRWEYNIAIVFNKLVEGQLMVLSDLG